MNLGGIDYVADVMNHVDRGNEKQIFDEMDKDNPELSKSIRDKMFMFENIIDMDPRSVQRFIRDCDSKDIVYALKTASEDMKNVFFANGRNSQERSGDHYQCKTEGSGRGTAAYC